MALAFIPSPSENGFHVGPLFVHGYGLAYVLALLAAVAITSRRWEREGGDRGLVQEVAIWGFPAGIVGARLYFLLTSWDQAPHTWWGPFAVWRGGLSIWGGIAAGTAAGIWVLHRRRADIPRFLDAAAPGLLVAQAIGRVGNYLNQELFGGPSTLPWAVHIDAAHRPDGYTAFATFHPTFLYEIIWNLLLAGALVLLGRTRRIAPPGLFALYVAGYSGFRIFEETLRIDPAHHLLGLRLNFYVAAILFLGGLIWFARSQQQGLRPRGPALLAAAGAAAVIAGCGHVLGNGARTTVTFAFTSGGYVTARMQDIRKPRVASVGVFDLAARRLVRFRAPPVAGRQSRTTPASPSMQLRFCGSPTTTCQTRSGCTRRRYRFRGIRAI